MNMNVQVMESELRALGFNVYTLPNGKHAVADPLDNEDGYYLTLPSKVEVVLEAYDHIRGLRQ